MISMTTGSLLFSLRVTGLLEKHRVLAPHRLRLLVVSYDT